MNTPAKTLWKPSATFQANSNLKKYMDWLAQTKGLIFKNYENLWSWSVEETSDFWESIWQYFEIKSDQPYQAVLEYQQMPEVDWFRGSTLNYAEHLFRYSSNQNPAIIFQSELHPYQEISWQSLGAKVASMAAYLKGLGVKKGDRVVAFIPNIPEASIGFMAACSLGAIWSSCSPDFGTSSVLDRFKQIEPKVLIVADGYPYNGKTYPKESIIREIIAGLPSLEKVIGIAYIDPQWSMNDLDLFESWSVVMDTPIAKLEFEQVPFDHPIWILYSSGTTGKPKAITHSHGGVLLEHYKYLAFHNDVHPGERFFWYSTTGWMMWNFVQAAFLQGATIVLYDGSPAYPNLEAMWAFAEKAKITHFGTSAPFLVASMKKGIKVKAHFSLNELRSISSTGAPLPPEAFDYVYEEIKSDLWLCSMSGGTDVCSAFVGGNPLLPVSVGEIQCRALGAALYAFDEEGKPQLENVGEMVITKPMPSMPIFFWGDKDNLRYLSSYFAMFEGVWRHGDWVKINDKGGLVIYGRSDATLNRHGIRIGTAEIYRSLNKISGIEDTLIVNLELSGGRHYMPLFVVMESGKTLNEEIQKEIKNQLRADYSPRHVPDEMIQVKEIPYTISGKKLEAPVKKILLGLPVQKAANKDAMRNPWAMDFFIEFAKKIK